MQTVRTCLHILPRICESGQLQHLQSLYTFRPHSNGFYLFSISVKFEFKSNHVNGRYHQTNINMKAARIVNVNEPLQIQELQTPKPKGSQILIKVQSSAVCHSDVHVWEG